MNNVERMFAQCGDARAFAREYLTYVGARLQELDVDQIARFIDVLERARRGEHTVFIIGNGGSAATASHMANDLAIGVRSDAACGFRALSLSDNTAAITAIANDSGFDNVFLYQLRAHYRPGDVLVLISASGNSPNLVKAADWVRERNGDVVGLLGFDGGRLKAMCTVLVHVRTPGGEYGPVEDVHMVVEHLLYSYLRCLARKTETV